MTNHRLTPEEYLKKAEEEEKKEKKGKLKIYLGAAPGVGKTHRMLVDAEEKKQQGIDVVTGVIESHGRVEIETLLKNFEHLPFKAVSYRGLSLQEFDLDGAIKRSPGLLLLDELAHTNVPGSRHNKRWQDVKELLEAGINVYTTLNVQHIESQSDIVAQIIQIPIKETVPDLLLELANTITVVDIPDDELLKRLEEGKIYFPDRAAVAKENYFRKGNLIALRELTLRLAASLVETQVLLYRHGEGIKTIWPIDNKLLVCVGKGEEGSKLIHTASRIANTLHADWIALHVDSANLKLSSAEHNLIIDRLQTAEQLGAEVRILPGYDIVKTILSFAREKNITQIIIGKKIRSRLRAFFYRSLSDEIVRHSGEIDIHVITGPFEPEEVPSRFSRIDKKIPWNTYLAAVLILLFITGINFLLSNYLYSYNLIMIYLVGVTAISLFGQRGPAIFSCIASVLTYHFFFVSPHFSFAITEFQSLVTLIVMLLVSLLISNLVYLIKRQAEIASYSEKRMFALNQLNMYLARIRGIDKIFEVSARYMGDTFNSHVAALYFENSRLLIKAKYGSVGRLSYKDQSIAEWVLKNGQIAGLGTGTLSDTDAVYIPLSDGQKIFGVLRLRPNETKRYFSPEEIHLLESCAHGIALAIKIEESAMGH